MENKPKIRCFTRSKELVLTNAKKDIHNNWLNDKSIKLNNASSINQPSLQLNYFYDLRK